MVASEDLAEYILNGNFDDHLEDISYAVRDRLSLLEATKGALIKRKLAVGRHVIIRLPDNVRPKYLNGHGGTVERIGPVNIAVKLDGRPKTFLIKPAQLEIG